MDPDPVPVLRLDETSALDAAARRDAVEPRKVAVPDVGQLELVHGLRVRVDRDGLLGRVDGPDAQAEPDHVAEREPPPLGRARVGLEQEQLGGQQGARAEHSRVEVPFFMASLQLQESRLRGCSPRRLALALHGGRRLLEGGKVAEAVERRERREELAVRAPGAATAPLGGDSVNFYFSPK